MYYKNDLEAKKITGNEYDEILKLLQRIETIAAEVDTDDIGGFQLKLAQEAIPNKIGEAYSQAISRNAQNNMPNSNGMPGNATHSSGVSSYGTGSIIQDVKNLKEDPNKNNAIGLAKDSGSFLFRIFRLFRRF